MVYSMVYSASSADAVIADLLTLISAAGSLLSSLFSEHEENRTDDATASVAIKNNFFILM